MKGLNDNKYKESIRGRGTILYNSFLESVGVHSFFM